MNGSVFWFAFPYRPDSTFFSNSSDNHSVGKHKIPLSRKQLTLTVDTTSLRILVVDDSPSILKITARSLRSHGHHVEVEDTGSLGLARMKKSLLNHDFDG